MADAAQRQRLLAILAADVAGYSRLMSLDDRGTVAALDAGRAVFREQIEAHDGRVIDMAGDSVLAVFGTATGAVNAAIAIQAALAERNKDSTDDRCMRFRIGIHLGDVIEKNDGTVYGDGVNIAARLESLATPGGITISESVWTVVKGRISTRVADQGLQSVKNIADPVHAFRIELGLAVEPEMTARPSARQRPRRHQWIMAIAGIASIVVAAWLLIDRSHLNRFRTPEGSQASVQRSLAVMTFDNLSDDKANAYFSDGITDELQAMLSQIPSLRIIARSSVNQFRGKSIAVGDIGRQLGVSYLVEGSVRRAENQVRIAVQLTNALDGTTVWSQSYDRELKDILALQREIAFLIAGALQVKIKATDLTGSGTTDIDAWRLYLEANQHLQDSGTLTGDVLAHIGEAETLYERAIKRDPRFAAALDGLARAWFARLFRVRPADPERTEPLELDRIEAKTREALAIDPKLISAWALLSRLELDRWHLDNAIDIARQLADREPNSENAQAALSNALRANGHMAEAIEANKRAVALDPISFSSFQRRAVLYLMAGRTAESRQAIDQALLLNPASQVQVGLNAYMSALEGRFTEAALPGNNQTYFGWRALAVLGAQDRLRETLARIPHANEMDFGRTYILALLGRHDEALSALEASVLRQSNFGARMLYDPVWDVMRDTPRFRALLEKYGATAAHDRAQAWRKANPPDRPMPF